MYERTVALLSPGAAWPRPFLCAVLLGLPASSGAQTKQQMISDWERNRANVLAYVDAMPDSSMDFRAAPGVRTFAQQIDHIVSTNLEVAARTLREASAIPITADTAVYFHQKAALRAYAEKTYDYVLEALKSASPAQLAKSFKVFGQGPQSAARWMLVADEHSAWTLGQTVTYLRLNGVTPPECKLPF
jgi:hypothetical protein